VYDLPDLDKQHQQIEIAHLLRKGNQMSFAIKVIDEDGEEEYLCEGMGDTPAKYPSRHAAQEMVDFMKIGMDGEVQSINVVPYPKTQRKENTKCKLSKNV
jgi:hypothetical protein